MTEKQLEQFKKWFYDYVATFYGSDEIMDDNIRLKDEHTRRMCVDMAAVADELGLNDEQKLIAETTALFHDVGRFEQFKKFRTYNDANTVNHAALGLKILAEKKILKDLTQREKEIIITAIKHHGDKELADNPDEEILFFCKLIRDIDKLDIYYVMISRFDELKNSPEKHMATLGYPMSDGYSENIVQAVLDNRTINYKDFKSINDMVIGLLGWVVDINFTQTLRVIKERGHLDKLATFLPDTEDIRNVARHVKQILEDRVAASEPRL